MAATYRTQCPSAQLSVPKFCFSSAPLAIRRQPLTQALEAVLTPAPSAPLRATPISLLDSNRPVCGMHLAKGRADYYTRTGRKHVILTGWDSSRKMQRTKAAEPYPKQWCNQWAKSILNSVADSAINFQSQAFLGS